jgi:hypothetical protein
MVGKDAACDLRQVADFEQAARHITRDNVRKAAIVSSDVSRIADRLRRLADVGFESIDIHNVGRNQRAFIDMAGDRLLPALKDQ